MLAAMAAWAIVSPARADVFLTFALVPSPPAPTTPSGNISNNITQGQVTPAASLTLNVGDVRYVAVSLNTNGTGMGPVQTFWNSDPGHIGLAGWGMNMTFDSSIADNPYIPLGSPTPTLNENNPNIRIQGAQNGYTNTYPNQPYGPGYRQHVALSTLGINLSNDPTYNMSTGQGTPITVFKVVAQAPTSGPTNVVFSRLTDGPGGTFQNTWQVTDGSTNQFLDPEVFSNLHPNFSFPITVVPEPSSMALCGLALVGFGWRKLRRKNTVVA
jgi:hypothetical protein